MSIKISCTERFMLKNELSEGKCGLNASYGVILDGIQHPLNGFVPIAP